MLKFIYLAHRGYRQNHSRGLFTAKRFLGVGLRVSDTEGFWNDARHHGVLRHSHVGNQRNPCGQDFHLGCYQERSQASPHPHLQDEVYGTWSSVGVICMVVLLCIVYGELLFSHDYRVRR